MTVDNMPEQDPKDASLNAVSLYGSDGTEDFPVLKAFQCYIDAEQEKARKRMLSLCIFFGCLMSVVVAVFVIMLMKISERNQSLNDRLIEYAMNREKPAASSPVVVQPPQDSAAILALTSKIDSLQKKLVEDQSKAEKAAADAVAKAEKAAADAVAKAEKAAADANAKAEKAAREAAKPKEPTAEQLEITRLKALLAAEKERQNEEKERQRKAEEQKLRRQQLAEEKERKHREEIEAYRRTHYPELYRNEVPKSSKKRPAKNFMYEDEDEDDNIEELLKMVDDSRPKLYYRDDNDETEMTSRSSTSSSSVSHSTTIHSSTPRQGSIIISGSGSLPPIKEEYSIPVDRKSSMSYRLPKE